MTKQRYHHNAPESRDVDKGIKHYKNEELKLGQKVYYDSFPEGINFQGVVAKDPETGKKIIESTGESKKWWENRGHATYIELESESAGPDDVRNKKRKYEGKMDEGH